VSKRDLTAAMEAAVQAGTIRPVLLYEGEFYTAGSPSVQYLRLFTGVGTLSWDGKTWTGGGGLLAITPLEESREVKAIGFTVSVQGQSSSNIALALASVRQGKPGKLWLGLFDASWALLADPYEIANGRLDYPTIEDSADLCTIAVQYEDRLVDVDRARERRYTGEDQAIDYPTDPGFEFVPALQDMQFMWGGPGAAASPLATPAPSVDASGPGPALVGGNDDRAPFLIAPSGASDGEGLRRVTRGGGD
jgi:hypothetical protein